MTSKKQRLTWQCWAVNKSQNKEILIVEGEVTEKDCKNKAVSKFSSWDVVPYDEQDGWEIIYRQDSPLILAEYNKLEAQNSAEYFKGLANSYFHEIGELKAKIIELENDRSQVQKVDKPEPTPVADVDLLKLIKTINSRTRTPLKDLRVIAEAINDGTIVPSDSTEMVKRYKREAEASSKTALDWNQRYEELKNKSVDKKSGY